MLGSKRFSPWLHVYSAIAGEFREGWIPDNYYLSVVLPAIKGRYEEISEMRSLSARFFGPDETPDRGYVVNGRLFNAALEPVSSMEEFSMLVFDGVDGWLSRLTRARAAAASKSSVEIGSRRQLRASRTA